MFEHQRAADAAPASTAQLPPVGGAPQAGSGYGNLQPGYGGAPVAGQPGQMAGSSGGTCNAAAANFLIGELGTTVAVDQAKEASGAESVRVLYPGQPITQEFLGSRLNLDTNDENRITAVRCG